MTATWKWLLTKGDPGSPYFTILRCCDAGWRWAGIALDDALNEGARGEACISATGSPTQIWVVPTNEEIVVARQAAEALGK